MKHGSLTPPPRFARALSCSVCALNVVRISRLLLISAIAAFALFAHPAHADTRNFALVRCDETAGELVVREDSTEEEGEGYKTPDGYQSKWLDQLVEYISPPGGAPDDAVGGTYRHKTGEWQLSCTLKGAVYNIVISPWSVNDMVMGQCGAGDPDVELAVRRDKRVLVRSLRLGGTCSIGPNDAFGIGAVELSEPERVATQTLKASLTPTKQAALSVIDSRFRARLFGS